MKLTKLALGVLTVGVLGVLGFQQVFKPMAVSAATTVKQVVRNTLVTAIRDPFYPDYYHRVFVFPTAFAGWWFGDAYATNLMMATFTSLDPQISIAPREFYVLGYTYGRNGLELPVMNGNTPDSCYMHYAGSLTKSDDYNFLFPSSPSGELTSPIRVQIPEGSLDVIVYAPARWWKPLQ